MWITAALAADVSYIDIEEPSTFNPLYARSDADRRAHELVFDWLFYRSTRTGALVSTLVERTELSGDGDELTIVLRDGISWHDGHTLSPGDVCFTIDAIRDVRTRSPLSDELRASIAGCTVRKGAAVISLAAHTPDPREHLVFPVLPKHGFDGTAMRPDDPFSTSPVGTGPMRMIRGRRELRFVPFPNPHHDAALLSRPSITLGDAGDPLLAVRTLLGR